MDGQRLVCSPSTNRRRCRKRGEKMELRGGSRLVVTVAVILFCSQAVVAEAAAEDGSTLAEDSALTVPAEETTPVEPAPSDPAPVEPAPSDPVPAALPAEAGEGESVVVMAGSDPQLSSSLLIPTSADVTLAKLLVRGDLHAVVRSGEASERSSARPSRSTSEPRPSPPIPADKSPAPVYGSSGGVGGGGTGSGFVFFATLMALPAFVAQRARGMVQLTVAPLRPLYLVSHLKRPG